MASRSIRQTTPVELLGACSPARALTVVIERRLIAIADAFAYSSTLAAFVGGAITFAVGGSLGSPASVPEAALVASGAFLIYNVDRLRDLTQDATGSPGRTAFVLRNRRWLVAATGIAALATGLLLATSPAPVVALCAVVGSIGLLHRRLKRDVRWKVVYVAMAWSAACVGIPRLDGATRDDRALAFALIFVGSSILANLIASNLRDGKRSEGSGSRARALAVARGVAVAAALLVFVAPDRVAPLAWIPAAEAAALCFFRRSERFSHLAVDGSLLLGALLAIVGSGA